MRMEGGDGLGEGVQVNDPLGLVDGEQRRDGPTHEAELAIVVILQYPASLLLLRPAQQLLPPSDGHDDARGIVVGGREVDDIRLLTAQKPGGKALFIQSHLPQIHLMAAVNFRILLYPGSSTA